MVEQTDFKPGWFAGTMDKARLDAAFAEVDAAEKALDRARFEAEKILRAARQRLHAAWLARNELIRQMDEPAPAPTEANERGEGVDGER